MPVASPQKTIERLHVAPEAMVVRDLHLPVHARGRGQDSLHAARGEGERALAEHVDLGGQRRQRVRLVQVIGRGDDDGVEVVVFEHVLDVVEDVGDVEPVGKRAGLGAIVVAQRNQLHAAELAEHRKVRELRDRARPDDRDAQIVLHVVTSKHATSETRTPPDE
jgi:hypothetical protein